MEDVIITENLKKNYRNVLAVDGINLRVGKGEIYGFLGLNGAGKTTTIRMLLGMIRPTAGVAWLKGVRINSAAHSLWNHVGYLVEIPYSYPDLTVWENLEMVRRLRLLPGSAQVESIISKLQLTTYRNRLAKNLSLGNAQRLGLAKALIHHPEILILDEPANGLDPAGIVEVREMLYDLALNQGVTVFISSHILGEISKLATRIGIIHEGRIIREFETGQLDDFRHRSLQVVTNNPGQAKELLEHQGYVPVLMKDGILEIRDPRAMSHPEKVNLLLVNGGYLPSSIHRVEEDLETYFLRLIRKGGGVL